MPDKPRALPLAPRIPRNVLIVAFVALASGFGQDLITPALPGFLLALGIARTEIGFLDGLLNGTTALFRLVSGILSDRARKRKSLVFIGYALSSVARPLLVFASTIPFIAALRTIDGVGKGTKDAPRDALIADSSDGIRGKAFGFHRLVDTAGSVLGPFAASVILLTVASGLAGYRLIFALSAIPGAIALGLIFFGVREPNPVVRQRRAKHRGFPAAFWIFLGGTTLAMLTRANDALVLVRAADAGIPAPWIPAVFGAFTLLYALLSYPIGVWSDRVGRLPFLVGGWFVLAAAEAMFAIVGSEASLIIPFALFGLFYALTEGSGRAFIADLVPEESRGTAYAIFQAVTGVALIIGGYGIGRIWDTISLGTAFGTAAIGSAIGAIVLAFLLANQRRFRIAAA